MYKNVVLTMANQLIESIPVEAFSVYYNNKVWDINPKRKAYCLARGWVEPRYRRSSYSLRRLANNTT
ncbi:hypothetical protein DOS81_06210 [Staphylococcus felis]|nr:hypothetical protein DOS81_06210 [Staphylococcus felis]